MMTNHWCRNSLPLDTSQGELSKASGCGVQGWRRWHRTMISPNTNDAGDQAHRPNSRESSDWIAAATDNRLLEHSVQHAYVRIELTSWRWRHRVRIEAEMSPCYRTLASLQNISQADRIREEIFVNINEDCTYFESAKILFLDQSSVEFRFKLSSSFWLIDWLTDWLTDWLW